MSSSPFTFPPRFLFGAAAAAYQIEGSPDADGKGPSVWDAFSHRPGKIHQGQTGDVACDHYRRYADDARLMKTMGLQAYRGSVSWSRVQPEGRGRANEKGLDFYSKLVDSLLENDVRPFLTLFHWDLPLALQTSQKGFQSRDTVQRFGDYADLVVRRLGDRVKDWITVNEPFEFAVFGHFFGNHAPGLTQPWLYFPDAKVGATLSHTPVFAEKPGTRDDQAARLADQFMNGITLDPLFKGSYPAELAQKARWLFPKILPGDMEKISAPCDFVGLNYYSREAASYKATIPFLNFWVTGKDNGRGEGERGGVRTTAMGWEVYPQGLRDLVLRVKNDYGNPLIYITENGAAFTDEVTPSPEGDRVHDPKRVEFLHDYLTALSQAMEAGARVEGYFVWSLMDNFEWAEGFRPRFGLVRVDYDTQKRTLKDSAYWYRRLIGQRTLPLPTEAKP